MFQFPEPVKRSNANREGDDAYEFEQQLIQLIICCCPTCVSSIESLSHRTLEISICSSHRYDGDDETSSSSHLCGGGNMN